MKSKNTLLVIGVALYFAASIIFQFGSADAIYKLIYTCKEKMLITVLGISLCSRVNNSVLIFTTYAVMAYQAIFVTSRILIYIHTLGTLEYALLLSSPFVSIPLCLVAGISLILLQKLTLRRKGGKRGRI